MLDLLKERAPKHVYVAGDLSDPHGTHRMCYFAIKAALARYNGTAEADAKADAAADGDDDVVDADFEEVDDDRKSA